MQIIAILIPVSIGLGALGLLAFVWALRSRQYDDPEGDAHRLLSAQWDERPKP